MKKIMFLYIALIGIIGIILISQSKFNFLHFGSSPTATIDGKTFNLLIARTAQEQTTGLSGRSKLDSNLGMLFPFGQKEYWKFWMKGMEFPIDIIYISDNKIVDIVQNAQAPAKFASISDLKIYSPKAPANYVLEINAGLSKQYGFKSGDTITISGLSL